MRRALVIDDEELSIELIKYLIKRYDLPVDIIGQASSGDQAVHIINTLKPDLVFIDIEMPVINGLQVMEKVKASGISDISFIVITAYGYFEYAQAALRLGASDILLKPVEPELFLETMERVLGYKHFDNKILNQIMEYINVNYNENIELKSCAEMFHANPSYVARLFKRYCDTSLIAYVNQRRIKMAVKCIRETDMSIKEIALKTGYNNLNYFYKPLKKSPGPLPMILKGLVINNKLF